MQLFGDKLTAALSIGEKHKRGEAVGKVEGEIFERFVTAENPSEKDPTKDPLTDQGAPSHSRCRSCYCCYYCCCYSCRCCSL